MKPYENADLLAQRFLDMNPRLANSNLAEAIRAELAEFLREMMPIRPEGTAPPFVSDSSGTVALLLIVSTELANTLAQMARECDPMMSITDYLEDELLRSLKRLSELSDLTTDITPNVEAVLSMLGGMIVDSQSISSRIIDIRDALKEVV